VLYTRYIPGIYQLYKHFPGFQMFAVQLAGFQVSYSTDRLPVCQAECFRVCPPTPAAVRGLSESQCPCSPSHPTRSHSLQGVNQEVPTPVLHDHETLVKLLELGKCLTHRDILDNLKVTRAPGPVANRRCGPGGPSHTDN
jgi:hypothetical protein